MNRRTLYAGLGAIAGALGLWTAWGLYVDYTTERVQYDRVAHFDGIELRRYPATIAVTTTASSGNEAFRRLFRYISGTNTLGETVSMTTPVAMTGEQIPMTAPVTSTQVPEGVTMSFYLPADYDYDDAPEPTDPLVSLELVGPRNLAVLEFSGWARSATVDEKEAELLQTLERHGIEPAGEPFFMGYDDPWTPPFMRRNEVAVPVS
ncbi:SOUL family heme-binding protein [Haloarchaeobius amylolyticus]|uniref:SOUL family heme-binding protein n=1 Tax=Haloarchaeobius amylolyticus TaxID=1198296 RepID=UPI00226F277A|nr:heme-binding protein [Haloarchaeobius amylolyticus]